MASETPKSASRGRARSQGQYWKVDVYPWRGFGVLPDKSVIVLGETSEDALNRVQGLLPENGRLLAKKVRPTERYKAITKDSALVERA